MTNRQRWTRRRFIRVATLSGLGALAAACGGRATDTVPSPLPSQPGTEAPTSIGGRVLTNENNPAVKPDWHVRYFQDYRPVDHEAWRLTVDGLVDAARSFSLDDVLDLPRLEQNTRMKCVECWSARADWAGFEFAALTEIVSPQSEATWITFECGDGYYESLSVDELAQPGVLFAYEMDGEPLLDEFGAPLRLIVPPKYGYKGPKVITRMTFTTQEEPGYWPTVGPYSTDGRIQAGRDFPLDIGEPRDITGGEITDY